MPPHSPFSARARRTVTATAATAATAAAAVTALLLAGCGASDAAPGGTPAPAPAPASRTYDENRTRVEAAVGERFALRVTDRTSAGYDWVLAEPAPDTEVVKATGERTAQQDSGKDSGDVGSFGTRLFDFRALSPGRTTITLRSCYRCGTRYEKADEDHPATRLTFDVHVRK